MNDNKINGLNIIENNSSLFLDNERVIITSTNIFSELRKDLSENIGDDRVKAFLLRYGWNLGKNDALKIVEQKPYKINDMLKKGPVLHELKGYTKVKNTKFEVVMNRDNTVNSVHVEGIWFNSYEAEENLSQNGIENTPVCYTLIGYASGYYSTICKKRVIFTEVACKGMGHSECYYVGKTLNLWDGEVDKELNFYHYETIVKELETAYEKLLEERNNLTKALKINEQLTSELIDGSDLNSIVNTVYHTTQTPFLINNASFSRIAFAGLQAEELQQIEMDLADYMKKTNRSLGKLKSTTLLRVGNYLHLITPIQLQQDIFGYCSFIYETDNTQIPEVDYMIIDKISSVCSIYLLNEKSRFEAIERIKGTFLEQIISRQITSKNEMQKHANYINIDLETPFYIVALTYKKLDKSVNELLVFEQVMELIFQYFREKNSKLLIGQYDGFIILFVQSEFLQLYNDEYDFWDSLHRFLQKRQSSLIYKAGISSLGKEIEKTFDYYEEAVTALKIGGQNNQIVKFEDIGLTGILISSQNKKAIIQKASHLLHPLYKDGQVKDVEQLRTLYKFLINGGNLERTMEDLSLSLSGLRYRISRIETLINKNLRNPEISYELLLTLKTLLSLGEIDFE